MTKFLFYFSVVLLFGCGNAPSPPILKEKAPHRSDNRSKPKAPVCEHSIIQIKHIRDILPYIGEKTLVVLDMDQTVIMDPKHGSNVSYPITRLAFVEDDTLDVLKRIVDKKGKLMGLTARGYFSREHDDAHDRMRELGFVLTCNWLDSTKYQNMNLHAENFVRGFKKCIFYTGHHSKGAMLTDLLSELKKHSIEIHNIVFVDDTKTHCHDINNAAKSANINSCAFHYTYAVAN